MVAVVQPSLKVRNMRARDLDRVSEIEKTGYNYPWSKQIFRDCIRAGYICKVLLMDREIVGYGIASVAAEESHLMNVCIDAACRGQGLGRILVEEMVYRVKARSARVVFLEVRESNVVARGLYEHLGFEQIGVREKYYRAKWGREDAVVLCRRL